jgi:predicted DNA-binding transcriptional regulator AlpA
LSGVISPKHGNTLSTVESGRGKGKMSLNNGSESRGKEMNQRTDGQAGKRLLNVDDAAAYLGISPRTLYNGVAPKSKTPFPVKPKRWGKRVLFDIKDLDSFADSLE